MSKAVLTEYTVYAAQWHAAPVRIAHVSDLHSRPADDILELLREQHPDIIVITGDTLERYDNRPQYDFDRRPIKRAIINAIHYTNWFLRLFESDKKRAKTENAYRFLSLASEIAPVYMSLGNHEQKLTDDDRRFIRESGIVLLDNADTVADIRGERLRIGGMSSWDYEEWFGRFAKKAGCKLLLCHHPERFEPLIQATDIPLTLSGHTHGGQFRVGKKGRGFFVPGQGLFGRYAHGMFFGGRLIVSAGCANTVAFPRLYNPRELVVVTMRGKKMREFDISSAPLEIERKFLIHYPDISVLCTLPGYRVRHIEQTYLSPCGDFVGGRIRRITEDGCVSYVYTYKERISDITRREYEREISEEEYRDLMRYKTPGTVTVVKDRHVFDHAGLSYELDIYDFWHDKATLECEVDSEDTDIPIPPCVSLIREVTFDRRYNNSQLARSGGEIS